jgi:conserved oligomeric Golgi complex subunit 3
MPSFAKTMRDAKTDLDSALRSACEALIQNATSNVTAPLRAFLGRCDQFLSTPTADGLQADLPGQAWASPEAVRILHDSFVGEGEGLEKGLRDVLAKMGSWLDDPDAKTIGVLVPPLQVSFSFFLLPFVFPRVHE